MADWGSSWVLSPNFYYDFSRRCGKVRDTEFQRRNPHGQAECWRAGRHRGRHDARAGKGRDGCAESGRSHRGRKRPRAFHRGQVPDFEETDAARLGVARGVARARHPLAVVFGENGGRGGRAAVGQGDGGDNHLRVRACGDSLHRDSDGRGEILPFYHG